MDSWKQTACQMLTDAVRVFLPYRRIAVTEVCAAVDAAIQGYVKERRLVTYPSYGKALDKLLELGIIRNTTHKILNACRNERHGAQHPPFSSPNETRLDLYIEAATTTLERLGITIPWEISQRIQHHDATNVCHKLKTKIIKVPERKRGLRLKPYLSDELGFRLLVPETYDIRENEDSVSFSGNPGKVIVDLWDIYEDIVFQGALEDLNVQDFQRNVGSETLTTVVIEHWGWEGFQVNDTISVSIGGINGSATDYSCKGTHEGSPCTMKGRLVTLAKGCDGYTIDCFSPETSFVEILPILSTMVDSFKVVAPRTVAHEEAVRRLAKSQYKYPNHEHPAWETRIRSSERPLVELQGRKLDPDMYIFDTVRNAVMSIADVAHHGTISKGVHSRRWGIYGDSGSPFHLYVPYPYYEDAKSLVRKLEINCDLHYFGFEDKGRGDISITVGSE